MNQDDQRSMIFFFSINIASKSNPLYRLALQLLFSFPTKKKRSTTEYCLMLSSLLQCVRHFFFLTMCSFIFLTFTFFLQNPHTQSLKIFLPEKIVRLKCTDQYRILTNRTNMYNYYGFYPVAPNLLFLFKCRIRPF